MICPSCNKNLPDDSEFCQYCGAKISLNNLQDNPQVQQQIAFDTLNPNTTSIVNDEIQLKNKAKSKKQPKKRYCKICGGLIDNKTKKCTSCEKQYSRIKIGKILIGLLITAVVAVGIYTAVLLTYMIPMDKYNVAMDFLKAERYDEAYSALEELGTFNNANNKANGSRYDRAMVLFESEKYDEAYELFVEAGSYSDAQEMAKESKYLKAKNLYNAKKYEESNPIFEELGDYKDSASLTYYHKYVTEEYVNPTCTEKGYRILKCTHCEDEYKEYIDKISHDYGKALCTETATCIVCGEKREARQHTLDNGYCERCFSKKTYAGSSNKKIDEIYLPNGKYSINYSYSGGGLFGARFYNQLIQSSPYHTVLSLERKNNINETHVIEGSFENACIDVECYGGEWSITIDRIGE